MYYKTTDSEGNEWATSRSNPTKIVNYAGEYSGHPKMRWTASKPKSIKNRVGGDLLATHTVIEIEAKEYRAIIKKIKEQS